MLTIHLQQTNIYMNEQGSEPEAIKLTKVVSYDYLLILSSLSYDIVILFEII